MTIKPLYDDTWQRVDRTIINKIAEGLEIPANELFVDKPEQPELFEGKKK